METQEKRSETLFYFPLKGGAGACEVNLRDGVPAERFRPYFLIKGGADKMNPRDVHLS